MPELPEVETVVRDLRPLVVGRAVRGVRHGGKKLRTAWEPAWDAAVVGRRVEGVRRRGKWIVVELEKNLTPPPPSRNGKGEPISTPHADFFRSTFARRYATCRSRTSSGASGSKSSGA